MSDPAPTTNPLHQALDWTRQKASELYHSLASLNLSKPAAEVATVAEAVFEAALPVALEAGVPSVGALLTPAQYQALALLVGEINATIVKAYLSRIEHTDAPKAP